MVATKLNSLPLPPHPDVIPDLTGQEPTVGCHLSINNFPACRYVPEFLSEYVHPEYEVPLIMPVKSPVGVFGMNPAFKTLFACLSLMLATQNCWGQQNDGFRQDRGDFGGRGGPRGTTGDRGFGGGRGGFGGPQVMVGGGILGELMNPSNRIEINLTEDQAKRIEEIAAESANNREQFTEIFNRMRTAESEEERAAIRDEMRVQMEEQRVQTEDQLKAFLSNEQVQRLDQLRLHREGLRAFNREDIQQDLGLSESQIEQMTNLQEERNARFRELGFGSSPEQQAQIREEFDQKLRDVLTPDQRTAWERRLGPPPADAGGVRPQIGGVVPGTGATTPPRPRNVLVEEAPEGSVAVMSFGGTETTPDGPRAAQRSPEEVRLTFNFRFAPWSEVLRLFAREAGLSLDLLNVPPGTFSYFDQKSYTPREALDVLNGYLLPKGYVLVYRDDFLVCLNIDDPIPPNIIPNVKPEDLVNRGRNELLTVVFPLEGVEAAQIAAEINEVKGPQGKVAALTSINSVLVTDIGSNLSRINLMLQDLTTRTGPNEPSFKDYQIRHIPAADAETLLREILGLGISGAVNVSAASSTRGAPTSSRSSSNTNTRGSSNTSTRDSSPVTATTPVSIATDQRTNKLLISANLKTHLLIEQALKTIDIEGAESDFSAASNRPFLRVYSVTSADAREVVKTIDAIMPGVVVNEDSRNRKIHIMASPNQHQEVDMLIRQMDGQGSGLSQQMLVIPLSHMDAMTAAATLRTMFLKDGDLAPTIEPDVYGRQLLIRGDASQIAEVRGLLTQLGEDGSGVRDRTSTSRVRMIPLNGRDPEELLPLLEQMWNQRSASPIRIVNPSDRGPVRDVRRPNSNESAREDRDPRENPASTQRSAPTPARRDSVQSDSLDQSPTLKPASQPRRTTATVLTVSQSTDVSEAATNDGVPVAAPRSDEPASASQSAAGEPADRPTIRPEDLTDEELRGLLDYYIKKRTAEIREQQAQQPETAPSATPAESRSSSPTTEAREAPSQDPQREADSENGRTVQTPVEQTPTIQMRPENAIRPSEIGITIVGDELILTTQGDPETLNQLEELLEDTMQAIPVRTSWTVFTLQTADATEAAMMLDQLLPYSNISTSSTSSGGMLGSFSSAASSLGSGIASMTGLSGIASSGQTLRIIPDTRLNALFVSGPATQVREVEEMLRVLDATDWPDSYRNKYTRLIPVEYADVTDVMNMVKDAYKMYVDPPQRGGRNNPLAAMMGGGGGGRGGDNDDTQIKMTVSADTNTNQLVVWADESLFREVETFVAMVDKNAQDARRTVQVFELQNTSSKVIQNSISTLIPRVNVSSSASRRTTPTTTPTGGTPTPGQPGAPSDADRDRMRQFFEQRMREQGGGGSTGGRPSFGGFGGGTRPGGTTGGGTTGRGGTTGGRTRGGR